MEDESQEHDRLVRESKDWYEKSHGSYGGAIRSSGYLDYDSPGAIQEHNRQIRISKLEEKFRANRSRD